MHGTQVAASVSEDALYLLFAELEKGLEDPVRRPAAAAVLTHFCATSKLDYQEHVPSLLTVCHCLTTLASLALFLAPPPGSYPFVLTTCTVSCTSWQPSICVEDVPSLLLICHFLTSLVCYIVSCPSWQLVLGVALLQYALHLMLT